MSVQYVCVEDEKVDRGMWEGTRINRPTGDAFSFAHFPHLSFWGASSTKSLWARE
jgi:hypothetical protein